MAMGWGLAIADDASAFDFSGVGWVQYGQVAKSTDTLPNNYNGNPMQNSGAQIPNERESQRANSRYAKPGKFGQKQRPESTGT